MVAHEADVGSSGMVVRVLVEESLMVAAITVFVFGWDSRSAVLICRPTHAMFYLLD